MNLIMISFGLLFYLHYQMSPCYSKTVTFFNTERPVVEAYNKKFCKNFTIKSKRISRQDPRHYVDIHTHTLSPMNNSLVIDFAFYKFELNRYRPSFIELHFKFCDMLENDMMFGQAVRNAFGGKSCPFPPGQYDLLNMSVPNVPKDFPFTKGRIYINMSGHFKSGTEFIGRGYIDMEVKVVQIRKT